MSEKTVIPTEKCAEDALGRSAFLNGSKGNFKNGLSREAQNSFTYGTRRDSGPRPAGRVGAGPLAPRRSR